MSKKYEREIIGQDSIQSFLAKEIKKKWNELSGKYSNDKGKILFTFFVMFTDVSHSLKVDQELEPRAFLKIPIYIHTLNEFLVHGWNVVEQVSNVNIQRYVDRVALEFLQLGHIKARAIESKIFGEEKIVLQKGWNAYDIPLLSESALDNWFSNYVLELLLY